MPKLVSEFGPYWQTEDGGVKLYCGHVTDVLRRLPARSVHCCVTSPPYWGLRSYDNEADVKHLEIGSEPSPDCGTRGQAQCGGCYVCAIVGVFREVRRAMRDDATLWLNIGDSYSGGGSGQNLSSTHGSTADCRTNVVGGYGHIATKRNPHTFGLKAGDLVGIPWRVALALQADGWVLRQDIIWYAPNKMPESVTNRCSKSHEHIFLLTKSMDYYYDHEAIKNDAVGKERVVREAMSGMIADFGHKHGDKFDHRGTLGHQHGVRSLKANKRDVWVVPTQGYKGAHFACYSPRLIEPCILAGTSEACCSECGAPYTRLVSRVGGAATTPDLGGRDRSIPSNRNGITGSLDGAPPSTKTVGWMPSCSCRALAGKCVVLDPFVGSGTTPATALALGRSGVGIDLSKKYIAECAVPRVMGVVEQVRPPMSVVDVPPMEVCDAEPVRKGSRQ